MSSGTKNNEHVLNNQIADIITSASEIKIVAPYITKEYTLVLQDRVRSGANVMLVLNDRRLWPEDVAPFYDKIKVTPGMELVNNPNVKYLMIWSPNKVIISSGPLDKNLLESTVLVVTVITEPKKIEKCKHIMGEMLPSFMR